MGARDLPALPLRPADAARLEGVSAVFAVLAGADRRRADRVRLGPGALTAAALTATGRAYGEA